jgi:hypothetical protein
MSCQWVLGWPFTEEWAIKYWTEYLKQALPPRQDDPEQFDTTLVMMNVVTDITGKLPLEGWRSFPCMTPDGRTALIFAIYTAHASSMDDLPMEIALDDLELPRRQISRMRRLLGRKGLPLWYPASDPPDEFPAFGPQIIRSRRDSKEGDEQDGGQGSDSSQKDMSVDGVKTPTPTLSR